MKQKKQINKKEFIESIVKFYVIEMMFLLPLVVTNGYFNITETKTTIFYILTFALIIITCGYGIFTIVRTKINLKVADGLKTFSNIDLTITAYGFLSLLSALISGYQSDVWFGVNSRYQGAVTILLYVVVYYIVSRNYSYSEGFLISSVIAFSIVCIVGVLNCFDIDMLGFYSEVSSIEKSRFLSTIGNINFYSSYMCLLFPLIICGFCQTKGKISQFIYTTALIIGSFGMMVTSSESFAVGFCIAMLIIPLFLFSDSEKTKKFLIAVIIIVASSQIYKLIYYIAEKTTKSANISISKLLNIFIHPAIAVVLTIVCLIVYRLISINKNNILIIKKVYGILLISAVSALIFCFIIVNTFFADNNLGTFGEYFQITPDWGTDRGKIWKLCIDIYSDSDIKTKLFGVGPEALYQVTEPLHLFSNASVDQAHNEYLHYLLTVGAFGLLSYLLIIVSVIYTVCKKLKSNTLAVGIFAALVAYWIQAMVNIAQPFTTPIMYLYVSIISGIYLYEQKIKKSSP